MYARREIHFLYYTPAENYPAVLNKEQRVTLGAKQVAADYPERLPHWQDFIDQYGPLEI